VPKEIVSDGYPKFTSNFWKGFGTNFNFNTAYHPDSDGQTKRTTRIIEDMLRMYVMDKSSRWEDCLHLVKFNYNNGYQETLEMSSFEALHSRKCNKSVSWNNPVDKVFIGPEFLRKMEEKMVKIRHNLKVV
jgi:hypothetical protein